MPLNIFIEIERDELWVCNIFYKSLKCSFFQINKYVYSSKHSWIFHIRLKVTLFVSQI